MQKPTEFFKNLPKKICATCGVEMEEQSESYVTECGKCIKKKEK